jgi:hypothetical protein
MRARRYLAPKFDPMRLNRAEAKGDELQRHIHAVICGSENTLFAYLLD